jgi:polygalacturonase
MIHRIVRRLEIASAILLLATGVGALTGLRCPAAEPPTPGFNPVFNVKEYGAVGDGTHLDSPAINRAIEAASSVGGGTVLLPAGTYLSGSIHLTNNLELRLGPGATLLGAPQAMNAYDPAETWQGMAYQDGGHTYFHNSLIWGENLTNVSISGPGLIRGGGLVRNDELLDKLSGFSNWGLTNAPPRPAATGPVRLGNKAIALKLCRNVLLRDVTILHGGHFAVLATGCDGLTVDNVTIDTDRDGIDIDCCRNTTVANCRINSPGDDALCPKSSFALGRNVITENLTIVNCQVSGFEEGSLYDGSLKPGGRGGTGRIKFGTEANGGFRNVTVANCTFRRCQGLALEEVDGGIMENITINNLSMMDVVGYPIYLTTGRRNRGPHVTEPSRMRNILISNVIATGIEPMSGIQITGVPDHPIEGVRLENIRLVFKGGGTRANAERVPPELGTGYPEPGNLGVMPAYGVFARHVRDLELASLRLSFEKEDLRPAIVCVDVNGLEIDNFAARLAPGVVAGGFDAVTGLVIRDSPVLQGIAPAGSN